MRVDSPSHTDVNGCTVVTTGGVRVLDDDVVRIATAVRSEGAQVAPSGPPWARFGLGFQLPSGQQPYPSDRSFGHDGAGGPSAFADPHYRLGFAFVTNSMGGGDDVRSRRLLSCLERLARRRGSVATATRR